MTLRSLLNDFDAADWTLSPCPFLSQKARDLSRVQLDHARGYTFWMVDARPLSEERPGRRDVLYQPHPKNEMIPLGYLSLSGDPMAVLQRAFGRDSHQEVLNWTHVWQAWFVSQAIFGGKWSLHHSGVWFDLHSDRYLKAPEPAVAEFFQVTHGRVWFDTKDLPWFDPAHRMSIQPVASAHAALLSLKTPLPPCFFQDLN